MKFQAHVCEDAWDLALRLNEREYWEALSKEAARQLEWEMALNVYRQLGDAAMVLSLQNLQNIEEKTLLAGNEREQVFDGV